MKMSGKDLATLLILVGVGGYSFYGVVTETGPIAWLNHAQQAMFGVYYWKFSMLLLFCLVGVLALMVGFVWRMVTGAPDGDEQSVGSRILFGPKAAPATPPASQEPATTPASQGRMLVQIAILFVVATWTIGFGIYWWYASEQREDARAQYEPIDLSSSAPLRQPRGSHIALQGGVPLDTWLVHKTDSGGTTREDYQLVPIASRGWVKGQAVAFVVRIKDRSELQDPIPTPLQRFTPPPSFSTRPPLPPGVKYADQPQRGAPEVQDRLPTSASAPVNQAKPAVLMARIDGPVPGPVALEFKKIGVPLGEKNYLLRPVKSRDGKVITESIEEAFMFFLSFCGIISALICVLMGGAWIMLAKAARKGLPSG